MARVYITVMDEDNEAYREFDRQGDGWLTENCPVANALKRKFPNERVRVNGRGSAEVGYHWLNPSTSLQHAIEAFDNQPHATRTFPIGRYALTVVH